MKQRSTPRPQTPALLTIAFTILDPPSSKKIALHAGCGVVLRRLHVLGAAAGAFSIPLTFKHGLTFDESTTATTITTVTGSSGAAPTVSELRAMVPAGHVLWVETGSLSGSPTQLHVTVEYETIS